MNTEGLVSDTINEKRSTSRHVLIWFKRALLPDCLSVSLSDFLSLSCLSSCLFICLCFWQFVGLSIYLAVCLSACQSACLSLCVGLSSERSRPEGAPGVPEGRDGPVRPSWRRPCWGRSEEEPWVSHSWDQAYRGISLWNFLFSHSFLRMGAALW